MATVARAITTEEVEIGREGVSPHVDEDLGVITPDVEALRDYFQLAGTKLMEFAFDGTVDILTC